jgi:hypothetical protein
MLSASHLRHRRCSGVAASYFILHDTLTVAFGVGRRCWASPGSILSTAG